MVKTNAEKCRERRERLRQDPERYEREKRLDRERRKRNYHKQQTPEEIEHTRKLKREAQRRYFFEGRKSVCYWQTVHGAKKKLEKEARTAQGLPAPRITRLDTEVLKRKREANRLYVQKHRAQQSAQKKRRVREKNRQYYYRKKEERQAVEVRRQELIHRQENNFKASGCPYPTQSAAQRAVQRIKQRLRAGGVKLAFLFKRKESTATTLSTPTKKLKEHFHSLRKKRDKESLAHKRRLTDALGDTSARVGVSARYSSPAGQLYKRRAENKTHRDIQDFFEASSCDNPCKTGKRQLMKPVKELHNDYIKSKPGVSLRTFHRLKPKTVASVKSLKFRQCKCDVCENPKLKLSRLNLILKKKCENVRVLLDESVCDVQDQMPKYECVNRTCEKCGVERVKRRLEGELNDKVHEQIRWQKWETVKEKATVRFDKVTKTGSVLECVLELVQELQTLYLHVFVGEWQRKQMQVLKADMPEGWAVATIDFAENFVLRSQDEVQSAHWSYKQVSLCPVVMFYRCPVAGCEELKREELAFFTDELKKDGHLSQSCIEGVLRHLLGKVPNLRKVLLVSDGCAAQFKSRLPFWYLSQTAVEVEVEKVFFGARHGKNDSDWSGGAIKRALTRDIASGSVSLTSAREVVEHCAATMSFGLPDGECCHKTRQFLFIDQSEIKREVSSSQVSTVPGSRKLHHVRAVAPGVLATRNLACFCQACKSGMFDHCSSSAYVGQWSIVRLKCSGITKLAAYRRTSRAVVRSVDSSGSSSNDDTSAQLSKADVDLELVNSGSENEDDDLNLGRMEVEEDEVVCGQENNGTDRASVFGSLAVAMGQCTTFAELQDFCLSIRDQLSKFSLPSVLDCELDHLEDNLSSALLSGEVQGKCKAYSVIADGNCFFRTLSLLLFGTEVHFVEMRVRVVLEMALNPHMFLDGKQWCRPFDKVAPDDLVRAALLTAVTPDPSPGVCFEKEVLSSARNSSYAGMFHFLAAAVVLKCPVRSVYPSCGQREYWLYCNHIFRPPSCSSERKAHIMWTTTSKPVPGQALCPNHFVPLILKPPQQPLPRKDSFYMLMWEGCEMLAQVLEVDEIIGLACVHFLRQRPKSQLFFFAEDDFSWEPFSAFKKDARVELVAEASTQRCLYYSLK